MGFSSSAWDLNPKPWDFTFTTAEVAARIDRAPSTVRNYISKYPVLQKLCRKVSNKWMWHEDCFKVFHELGIGRMIIVDDPVDIPDGEVHRVGRKPATPEGRLSRLIQLIVGYHQRGDIPLNPFLDMQRYFKC